MLAGHADVEREGKSFGPEAVEQGGEGEGIVDRERADDDAGYEYPDQYYRIFGEDYKPPAHIEATYKMLRNHKWYMEPRLVTVNDLYAFDPKAVVSIDPFQDIIGRHFKQPKEGLGYDNSPSAHMWRTLARPDNPL